MFKKSTIITVLVIAVILVSGVAGYIHYQGGNSDELEVTNYQECKIEGGLISESHPEQCRIGDGIYIDDVVSDDLLESNNTSETPTIPSSIIFKSVPDLGGFEMSESEVTNQQYVDFLNEALDKDLIQIDEPLATSWLVYDKDGNSMTDLLGYRVIKDHNNDGVYELWEMENPLNRSMIEHDQQKKEFSVVDPKKVNWESYFDKSVYPDVVDEITDWAELQDFWPADAEPLDGKTMVSFYENDVHEADGTIKENITLVGHLDAQDPTLPTQSEVENWPVNFISYYGAKAFADFYGYQLPSYQEYQWAGKGGYEDRIYSTDDGTINHTNSVYNGEATRNGGKHKGYAQPVMSFAPNPYGLYDLGGGVTE